MYHGTNGCRFPLLNRLSRPHCLAPRGRTIETRMSCSPGNLGLAVPQCQISTAMRHSYSPDAYSDANYDAYFCLKPPLLLWVAVFYLSKAITIPAVAAIGAYAGVNADAISLLKRFWSAESLVPSLIAAVILYALCRRVPAASNQVRWIWAHGRILLAFSAGIDLVLSSISLIRLGEINDQVLWSLTNAAVDIYFLLYIFTARRVRDAFSEFPPADAAEKKSA